MLLRLIPEPPLPTVLFSLAFPNLPDTVPFPVNWTNQLQHALQDELELPDCIHALDKSAWAVCLLHEVNFCAFNKSVSCLFVDGTRMDWQIEDDRCMDALQAVIDDVNESAVAVDMEKNRARVIAAPPPPPVRPASPAKMSKHKKSRSLLMTLVASLVPLSQPSSPALPVYEPLAQVILPPEPPLSSRFLRRRARASLVDIYRRYILPELESPFPRGGYVFWIIRSMLLRIEGRMHTLVQELGGELPGGRLHTTPSRLRLRISPSALSESPFEDDESSSSSSAAETDTDASSVHTPRDSIAEYPLLCRASSSDDALINAENGLIIPSAVSTPPRLRSYEDTQAKQYHQQCQQQRQQQEGPLAEYAALHATTVRMRAMLTRTETIERGTELDRTAHLAILEVKGKRRAWSSHTLLGRATMAQAGLGTPLRSSPLARGAVQTPDVVFARIHAPGVRRRLGTICESESDTVPLDLNCDAEPVMLLPPLCVQPQGSIPFPQTESLDDFCSTGPQDPLPLFAHPSDDYAESSSTAASYSSDDLPGMFAAESYPLSRSSMGKADLPAVPLDAYTFDPASDRGCEEFTLALDMHAHTNPRRHAPGPERFAHDDWLVEPDTDYR
ncbi:hypothetical protein EW145_g4428 [Phellinidium pouzarii]|uniref:Uncharacterized protein n=1 Tax=Phellinidium pouzarii TaxID=167371 RepID=A0A4S4L3I8_9AGAM|nr:hypothetical protein EW145_g4428 [Phellinidium pouzarii]